MDFLGPLARYRRLLTPFGIARFLVLLAVTFRLMMPECGVAAGERILPNPPAVTAQAAILVNLRTGDIIYGKNADGRMYPASTTKIMTAILSMENGDNGSMVPVSSYAADVESTGLQPGQTIRMGDMLELMLLESDNGAATAIGEAVAGGETDFARMMNQKAQELGMTGSHFVNCNGMPDEDHYTTARDMAKAAVYAMEIKQFRRIVASQAFIMPDWENPGATYKAENTNELLKTYPGCIGVKTGYTRAAGGCLVSAAERDGQQLLCVVLKSSDMDTRFSDSAALLDYGFACAENGPAVLPKIDRNL